MIVKVFKFVGIQFRNVQEMESLTEYDELLFTLVETFFFTGKAPVSLIPKTLPQIKSPDHMDQAVDLRSFTNICQTFSHVVARWMLCGFFAAQLFQKIVVNSLSSGLMIVNALEELLTNCSARVLKASDDSLGRNQLDFTQRKVLVGAYADMVSEEIEHNHNESRSMQECFDENTSVHFRVDEDSLSEQAKKDITAGGTIERK